MLAIGTPQDLAVSHLAKKLNTDLATCIINKSTQYELFGTFNIDNGKKTLIKIYASAQLAYWRIEIHEQGETNMQICGSEAEQLWAVLLKLLVAKEPGPLEFMQGVEAMESNAHKISVEYISDGVHIFRHALQQYIHGMPDDEDKHWYLRWIKNEHTT